MNRSSRSSRLKARSKVAPANPMAISYSLHMRNIAAFISSLEKDESFFLNGPESRKAVAIVGGDLRVGPDGQPCIPEIAVPPA